MPNRRSIAQAVQILITHAFGDASGPWIVGAISDLIRQGSKSPEDHYHSLLYSFIILVALLLISGIAFLVTAQKLPGALREVEQLNNQPIALGKFKDSTKVAVQNGNV